MFKRTFVKYMITFSVIILVSFLILSGIVTSMIRRYAVDEKKTVLVETANGLAGIVEEYHTEDLYVFVTSGVPSSTASAMLMLTPSVSFILADSDGDILLTTVNVKPDSNGRKTPVTVENQGDLGSFSPSEFNFINGKSTQVEQGTLGDLLHENHLYVACPIYQKTTVIGYAVALSPTSEEDSLIVTTRRAVINASLWVMLAAIVATYFVSDRIVHPLKNMTEAAKRFGKGDFSTRVDVVGRDEVSALGQAFNQMAESLDNYEKMRNSFLASVSHDLRTPMTTIAGFIDGINSGAIPPEKQEYYLGIVSSEVHRLSRLVSELLDVSRLQSGERKFTFTDFDVAEVARLILISFEQKIEEKNLDVSFDTEEDSLYVLADKDAIYQVIYNLCHNGIKFAKEGGKFSISIRRDEGKKIRVTIYDEGLAVSKEEAPFVFEQFYKIDKSRGLDKNGVGLGLYICKTIVDAHGESISLLPNLTDGTGFAFTLKEGTTPVKKSYRPMGEDDDKL